MSAGGSTSNTDTRFERRGTSTTSSWRDFTDDQVSVLNSAIDQSRPGNADASRSYISSLLGANPSELSPFNLNYYSNVAQEHIPTRNFTGKGTLESAAQVNPFSNDYEEATHGGYVDRVKRLLADVESGPNATRGGTAATGFMQSDALNQASLQREQELRQNRLADFGISSGATDILQRLYNTDSGMELGAADSFNRLVQAYYPIKNQVAEVENQRQSIFNQLLPAVYQMLTPSTAQQTDNLEGKQAQSGSAVGWSITPCCFIFMEAYHGKMPEHVRTCRDEFAPENSNRRNGYIRMAVWLVPLMQKYKFVRTLVWKLMVQPMSKWGAFYKQVDGCKKNWIYKPFVSFWFFTWEKYGKNTK